MAPTSTIGDPFAQGHESTPNPMGDVLSPHPPFLEFTDPATNLDGLDQHAPHPEDQDELSMEFDGIHQYAV